jgi:hypothetical protein
MWAIQKNGVGKRKARYWDITFNILVSPLRKIHAVVISGYIQEARKDKRQITLSIYPI